MADNKAGGVFATIILGVLGGLAAIAVINALTKPKCPVCNNEVPRGANPCPHCFTALKWTQ